MNYETLYNLLPLFNVVYAMLYENMLSAEVALVTIDKSYRHKKSRFH